MNWLIEFLGGYTQKDMDLSTSNYNILLKKHRLVEDQLKIKCHHYNTMVKNYKGSQNGYNKIYKRNHTTKKFLIALKESTPKSSIYQQDFDTILSKLKGTTKRGRPKNE